MKTDNYIQLLAENALHEACKEIQTELGQDHGDLAGMFFSGENEDTIISLFKQYIRREIENKEQV